MAEEDDGELAREGAYSGWRMTDRAYHELIGICRGVIWDGVVTDEEIVRLDGWCKAYPEVYDTFPGDVLARRLRAALADGIIDDSERDDLKVILEELTGGRDAPDRPTTLPLSDPAPEIVVIDQRFCLTGTFVYGSRKRCEEAIEVVGGIIEKRVTRRLDYLVIGHRITPAWAQSTHGRKIEAAVNLRRGGHPVSIVSEEHWSRAMLLPPG